MSLSIFAVKNLHHKNGIWFWTKMVNRAVGEQRYDAIRVWRRIWSNKFYYYRQILLYKCFIQTPDLAALLGIYPKVQTTHGFPFIYSYEMYRDFQQNTINSDGSFGMWIVVIAALYLAHEMYNYFIPWYWNRNATCKNGEQQRIRMRDALASTLMQESTGMQFAEWGWMPHDYHSVRKRLSAGLSHPDDVRAMHMSTLNRRHRYKEHYLKSVNDKTRMVGF